MSAAMSKALDRLEVVRRDAMRVLEALEAEGDDLQVKHRSSLTPTAKGEVFPRLAFHIRTRLMRNETLQSQVMQMHLTAQQIENDLLEMCKQDSDLDRINLEFASADALEEAAQLSDLLSEIEGTL